MIVATCGAVENTLSRDFENKQRQDTNDTLPYLNDEVEVTFSEVVLRFIYNGEFDPGSG